MLDFSSFPVLEIQQEESKKKMVKREGKNPLGTVVTRIGAPSGDNCKMVSFPSFPDMEKQQEERVNVQK